MPRGAIHSHIKPSLDSMGVHDMSLHDVAVHCVARTLSAGVPAMDMHNHATSSKKIIIDGRRKPISAGYKMAPEKVKKRFAHNPLKGKPSIYSTIYPC